MKAGHSFGTEYAVSKSGYLETPIELPEDVVSFIAAWKTELSENEYFSVKFGVLAKKGTEWWLADPRVGIRP